MTAKLHAIKLIARIALGLVWFYEGLVPKILFLRADEINLVRASHLVWRTPRFTLQLLGVAQILVGIWLIIGIAERAAVFIATLWMLILIVLVARGNPSMLTDPYGALVKDFCLVACAITVWTLAMPYGHAPRKKFQRRGRRVDFKFVSEPKVEAVKIGLPERHTLNVSIVPSVATQQLGSSGRENRCQVAQMKIAAKRAQQQRRQSEPVFTTDNSLLAGKAIVSKGSANV